MKLSIVKTSFSRGSWRLIDTDTGDHFSYPLTIDHAHLGTTTVDEPVCGDTRRECEEAVLRFTEALIERLKEVLAKGRA